jgi:hypothetical protein
MSLNGNSAEVCLTFHFQIWRIYLIFAIENYRILTKFIAAEVFS